MRYIVFLLTGFLFVACETVTNEDGTTTTRFDAKTAASVAETGYGIYDRYQRSSRIVGYARDGTPIYR